MVTLSGKYTSNFTPATDLSVGAASQPLGFFINPGMSGNLQDLVSGSTPTMMNTVTATGLRYLSS